MPAALILAAALAASLAQPVAADTRAVPDETALRYYAQQKQTARVEAETERLRRRHPGWQPPADLWTAEPGGEDEEVFWELFSAGRLAELRAALDARAKAEPGWQPSKVLRTRLAQRELRLSALDHAKAGRWTELAVLADARRTERDEADIELAWAVAEAFARTDRADEAAALLRRAMEAPGSGPDERRNTVLKAMALLPMAEVEPMLASAKPGEFDAIAIDITRARISARLHDEPNIAISAAELAAFAAYAEKAPEADQPGLVAWYAYKRRDFSEALAWFKRAIGRGGDAMIAHGLAHTLRELGLMREAEEVAYAWREPLVNNTLLFVDLLERDLTREIPPPIEPERLRRYAEVTAQTASGEGAQALAWYAYNNCQFDTALAWFSRAVAWFPKEATVYGYALALRRMKRQRAFIETVNRYDGLFPKVVDLLFQAPQDRPMPCEKAELAPFAEARGAPSGYLDLAGYGEGRVRRGQVPDPGDVAAGRHGTPAIRRSDFPIAVLMENDQRFAPSAGGLAEGASDPRWSGRPIGRPPTVARRVPGVGAMPYERFGFSLLPGFDGTDAPSDPTAAERPAPLGTLWSEQRNGPAPDDAAAAKAAPNPSPDARRAAPPARLSLSPVRTVQP